MIIKGNMDVFPMFLIFVSNPKKKFFFFTSFLVENEEHREHYG